MKKLLVFVVALAISVPVWAQQTHEVIVVPTVAMATIDSIRTLAGSTTISTQSLVGGGRFASVTKGAAVWGYGIEWGTTVVDTSSGNDSVLVLSKPCRYTDSTGSANLGRAILNFGYYSAPTYPNGDFVGMPFEIPGAMGKLLVAVTLIDSSDTADSLDIMLFNNPVYAATPVLDTVAMSFANDDYNNIVGIIKLRTMTDLGNLRLVQEGNLHFPIGVQDKLYGRLVSRKAAGMILTSTSCLLLRFKFY